MSPKRSALDYWRNWLGIELNPVSGKEKIVSAVGGMLSILLLTAICVNVLQLSAAAALIASMGASAVLLFAVPHGQLSQPWPVIAGHGISAFIGVLCAELIPEPEFAAACAVGLAIGAMHQFKCIHPPGGATALTAVLGGPAVRALGFKFVLFPVLLNALIIIAIAVFVNRFFHWRRYPAFLNRSASTSRKISDSTEPTHDEIVKALRSLDSFVDITEDDLLRLIQILNPQRKGNRTPSVNAIKIRRQLSEARLKQMASENEDTMTKIR